MERQSPARPAVGTVEACYGLRAPDVWERRQASKRGEAFGQQPISTIAACDRGEAPVGVVIDGVERDCLNGTKGGGHKKDEDGDLGEGVHYTGHRVGSD